MAISPALPTNIGEKFARKTLKKFWDKAVTPAISNSDYEGEIKGGGADRVHILSFLNNVTLNTYTPGSAMTSEKWMGDIEGDLIVDQLKYYAFEIESVAKFVAYVDDLDSHLVQNAADVLAETIDTYILGHFTQVKAGHRVGSDYETKYDVGVGTATVTTGTGAVVITDPGMGNNSVVYGATNYRTFGAHIIGMGASFDAGVTWYKISVMDDSDSFTVTDWNDSTYSGGAKVGVEVVIEALYPIVVTSTNIYAKILDLSTKLDKDKIPQDNRFLVIPPDVGNLLKQSSQLVVAVQESYKDVVQNGLLGSVAGFKIYVSNQVLGNGTNGWHCLAGHKAGITFAHAMTESRILDSEDNFAKKYQGLNVYGAKVLVERRKALAELFCVITGTGDDWLKPTSGRV